jgi:hypothetical protein
MSKLKLTISLIEKELERLTNLQLLATTGKEHIERLILKKLLNNHIEEIKGMPQEFIDHPDRGDSWLRVYETRANEHTNLTTKIIALRSELHELTQDDDLPF